MYQSLPLWLYTQLSASQHLRCLEACSSPNRLVVLITTIEFSALSVLKHVAVLIDIALIVLIALYVLSAYAVHSSPYHIGCTHNCHRPQRLRCIEACKSPYRLGCTHSCHRPKRLRCPATCSSPYHSGCTQSYQRH